ncbi:MAG: hypothetical protein ACP5US_02065 [Candidatus Kryptoniota bacterium]
MTRRILWISIFVSIILGAGLGYYLGITINRNENAEHGKKVMVKYLTKKLQLSNLQQQQLDSILTKMHPAFEKTRADFRARIQRDIDSTDKLIMEILNSQQKDKFIDLINEMKRDKH